ncbi:MAG: prolipoprotein diacylglyceryl transferase [Candidatus Gracilibacteria bacterium]|nr:prolipoprotein diacylglyceryl transferase [Candidatus Gracilibacteria bacterium]
MFPQIQFGGVTIYTFGLALSISFILFFWMLYRLSLKFGINTNFFLGNVFFFFISSFAFSRFFYVIAEWRDFKYIFDQGVLKFFFMSDYNFSLIGGVVGFMLVLYINIKKFKLNSNKYVDAVVLSFLFAAIIGYIGAFLGGQIYGKPTDLAIGIAYTNTLSKNPYSSPTFPLAIIYSIISFLLFVGLYMARIFIKIEGFIGYIGIIIFASILLIFEFFNGSSDIFSSFIYINLTQIGALGLILIGARGLTKIYKQEKI